ncbi:hypothetical protein ES703_105502 [subsurface metagenome]
MAKCSQCDKTAVVVYDDIPLCVEHHLKMQQATYLQMSMVAANINFLQDEISTGTGGIVPPSYVNIPPPPFIGDNLTLNNINVAGSTIGAINTGTIKNLDISIDTIRNQGQDDLATVIKELTEVVIKSNELNEVVKRDIAEQLEYLAAQVTSDSKNRSIGIIKSILVGIRDPISISAGLLAIWDKAEPLFRAAFGV